MHLPTRFLLAVAFLFTIASNAQTPYYPDSVWLTKKPEELKMDAQAVNKAVAFAIENETKTDEDLRIANIKAYAAEPGYQILGPMKKRGKPAGLILKNGYIVAQWGDLNRVDMTFSVAKSYLSTVAGLAHDSRLIKSLDERITLSVPDENLKAATIPKSRGGTCLRNLPIGRAASSAFATGPTVRPKPAPLTIGRPASCWNRERPSNTTTCG